MLWRGISLFGNERCLILGTRFSKEYSVGFKESLKFSGSALSPFTIAYHCLLELGKMLYIMTWVFTSVPAVSYLLNCVNKMCLYKLFGLRNFYNCLGR